MLVSGEIAPDVEKPLQIIDTDAVVADEANEHQGHCDDQDRADEVVQVLGQDREPREQRVSDQRQEHRLSERQDEASDRQRHPGDCQQPVRIAVHGREALDQAPAALLVGTDVERTADHVEDRQSENGHREEHAAPEHDRHARRAPGLALRLDEDVRFASDDRGDLRCAGTYLAPHRRVVQGLTALPLGRRSRGRILRCRRRCRYLGVLAVRDAGREHPQHSHGERGRSHDR